MAGSDSRFDVIPREEMKLFEIEGMVIRAEKVELRKYLSKIGETIRSTPPHINIIFQSPSGSGKSTALLTPARWVVHTLHPFHTSIQDPGFKDCVVRIMHKRPQCQVIMCSTISSDAVEAFVSKSRQVLSEKEFVSFTGEMEVPSLDSVKQYKVNVHDEPSKEKVIINKLLDLIAEAGQTIVFVHTIDSARMLIERLRRNRFMYKTLDGADTQEQRDKILEEFKEKRFQVLISTKILDWVFDPSQVGLVVFYDLSIISGSSPEADLEQY